MDTETIRDLAKIPAEILYSVLETASSPQPQYLDVADDTVKGLVMGVQQVVEMQQMEKPVTEEDRKKFQKESVRNIRSLNISWMNEMVFSDAQLREKMSLFWHGHFACRNLNIFYQQLLLDEIRRNALTNFRDLLKGVSKSAAMLNFLNNQQNQKKHPNENFAREVMELFTLGRGNYTEQDVKEAARAFTGWSSRFNGEFLFRPFIHDSDEKTFLGKRGNFSGDDILEMLLEQEQTARFITGKLYRHFVNDIADEEIVNELADSFYYNNYDIGNLMKKIFTSAWFYDEKNIGCRIKSPVELLAGIRRILPMQLENESVQLLLQRALGQILFYPPNVAGWPGGKAWIDSSTLMLRLRIPQLLKDDDTLYISPKADDDVQMGMPENNDPMMKNGLTKNGFRIAANVDWDNYTKQFENIKDDDLYETISTVLLQTTKRSVTKGVVESHVSANTREEYIKSVTVAIMSTPEYQLC